MQPCAINKLCYSVIEKVFNSDVLSSYSMEGVK